MKFPSEESFNQTLLNLDCDFLRWHRSTSLFVRDITSFVTIPYRIELYYKHFSPTKDTEKNLIPEKQKMCK